MQIKTPTKNNLHISNSIITNEWHPTKNGSLTPRDVTVNSNKKVWWLCSHGHEWLATVNERSHGNSCPYCSNKKVNDENSLQPLNPPPAEESHPPKNESLTPKDVTTHSNKKVSPENCLQTVNPNLAKEWHPTKNGSLTPRDVTAISHDQVWWLCSKGHEWKAAISSRSKGQGCFYCSYMQRGKRQ
jgi:hypothetical protein